MLIIAPNSNSYHETVILLYTLSSAVHTPPSENVLSIFACLLQSLFEKALQTFVQHLILIKYYYR